MSSNCDVPETVLLSYHASGVSMSFRPLEKRFSEGYSRLLPSLTERISEEDLELRPELAGRLVGITLVFLLWKGQYYSKIPAQFSGSNEDGELYSRISIHVYLLRMWPGVNQRIVGLRR